MSECGVSELLAEDELIDIIPSFSEPVMHMITGDYGPLEAGISSRVPLWLALFLKQSRRCRIVPPAWMSSENIGEMIEAESSAKLFTPIPEHFVCMVRLLTAHAADDVPDCDDVNVKARDLVDKREAKLRSSVDAFVDAGAPHAEVQHLTHFEIGNVRAFMQEAIDQLNVINDAGAPHISAQE